LIKLARAGVAAAREHSADVIAAIGGGNVADAERPWPCWETR